MNLFQKYQPNLKLKVSFRKCIHPPFGHISVELSNKTCTYFQKALSGISSDNEKLTINVLASVSNDEELALDTGMIVIVLGVIIGVLLLLLIIFSTILITRYRSNP